MVHGYIDLQIVYNAASVYKVYRVNYLDLFHGIGGFALGAYWAGMKFENHYCSDIEPYCQKLYAMRFPDSVQLGDITKIDASTLPAGEWILSGGFPCQPFSSASRGRRVAVDLWPEMVRIIKMIKPKIIIAENVSQKAILKSEKDIEKLGYSTSVKNIGAHEIGADHKRSRWWLTAYPNNESKFYMQINAKMAELPKMEKTVWTWENYSRTIRIPDGISNRMDRLKGLGNAIVPQIAELLFRQIKELL